MRLLRYKSRGFSLVEIAIVLVIFGLILSALFVPLRAQREQAALTQTMNTIDNAKQALLGFAQANGRLPCPATNNGTAVFPDDTGSASPVGGGVCLQNSGFLPGSTLGVKPVDSQGYVLDAWNQRIRYAVSQTNNAGALNADFTTVNGMANQGIVNLQPNLRVCATQVGITPIRCSGASPETNFLINNAVAVVYSLGATGAQPAGSADEGANLNGDPVFVSHDLTVAPNEFDHIVSWVSPYVLYNAMIQAGQLH